jgi:uncharacterized protein YjhX (UPF0386 family)
MKTEAARAANHRRELNALRLLGQADMVIWRRDAQHAIGRNALGHAQLGTLHALERKRQVERLKGGRYRVTDAGTERVANDA